MSMFNENHFFLFTSLIFRQMKEITEHVFCSIHIINANQKLLNIGVGAAGVGSGRVGSANKRPMKSRPSARNGSAPPLRETILFVSFLLQARQRHGYRGLSSFV